METARNLLLIGLFGAAGALSRYGISLGVQRLTADSFPAGTLTVNLVGCLLLGLLFGLAEAHGDRSHALAPAVRDALMIGFLGSLTTFSTFSLEAIKCFERGAAGTALAYVAVSVAAGLAAGFGGLSLARWAAA